MTRARRVQGTTGSHPVARPQVEMDVQKQPSSNDAPSTGNLDSPSPSPIRPPGQRGSGPWIPGRTVPLVATLCVPSLTVRTSAPPDAAIDPVEGCSTTPEVLPSMPNPRVVQTLCERCRRVDAPPVGCPTLRRSAPAYAEGSGNVDHPCGQVVHLVVLVGLIRRVGHSYPEVRGRQLGRSPGVAPGVGNSAGEIRRLGRA